MQKRQTKSDDKIVEKFRAVLDENTSLSIYNKPGDRSYYIIRNDLTKDYEVEVMPNEAPILNKILSEPEPYESSLADPKILEEIIFPINEAIKKVFGDINDLNLESIKLAVGGNKSDYVTINELDLRRFDVNPTLSGLMDFIRENNESILGFLDREYINEEGNVIYLNCVKKSVSDNIYSIKLKVLASMQQRGYFLQQEHKYYGLQLYLIIESKTSDDDKILEFLKEIDINWELIFFRRKLAIHDWTEIECEKNAENLKNYMRSKYENLNYFDVNNITRLIVKNQLQFIVADKMASLLYNMKLDRSSQFHEDSYSITLKKAEIAAAARIACAYLGIHIELKIDSDISLDEVLKYETELTNM